MPGAIGKVVQVIGPVVDVKFGSDNLPKIFNAIEIKMEDKVLVCEVEQHIGDDIVRTISMDSTDGVKRGMEVVDTGEELPVRVFGNALA